jgi:hypothetical protein
MRLPLVARVLTVLAPLVVEAPGTAMAQGQDELWETTISAQSDGMRMPPTTQRICVPKGKPERRLDMDENCRVVESRQAGNKLIFRMACRDGADTYTASGEMEDLGRDAYRGFMTAAGTREGAKFTMRTDVSGKRAGNCIWEDPARQMAALRRQQDDRMARECAAQIGELDPGPFFSGPGLPGAICRDQQPQFCANAGKVLGGIRDRAGWDAAERRYDRKRLDAAAGACKIDVAATRAGLCQDARTKRDWNWFGPRCYVDGKSYRGAIAEADSQGVDTARMWAEFKAREPQEADQLRRQQCVGRSLSHMSGRLAAMCRGLGSTSGGITVQENAAPGATGAVQLSPGPAQGGPGAGRPGGSVETGDPQKKPPVSDTLIKDGADTLKRLLRF